MTAVKKNYEFFYGFHKALRGGLTSHPHDVYSLSCWNNSRCYLATTKKVTPLSWVIAFQITLMCKIFMVWSSVGCFCQKTKTKKKLKNAIFWCSQFKKFNFDWLLHKLLICSQKMKTYSSLCVLYGLCFLSWLQGLK